MTLGYFLIADLLGFSQIVNNTPPRNLNSRVTQWTNLIEETTRNLDIDRYQLMSDTLFAATDSSARSLKCLVKCARQILEKGLDMSLPVRGAISHGQYEWGKLIYGKAVIEANQLEKSQEWVGFACCNNLPHLDESWGPESLICYPVPFKTGPIRLHPAVAWDIPPFDQLTRHLTSKGLTSGGKAVPWELGAKITNTVHFSIYLRMVRTAGADPSRAHGLLPVQAIENNLFRTKG